MPLILIRILVCTRTRLLSHGAYKSEKVEASGVRIVVCIKQVPVVSAMQFDATSKTLKREGVPTEVSSFDVRALIKAVDLVRVHGGEVVALTMGPPQAREALVECLALGADRAVHLCDRAFAGSDTLATARVLAAAIRREPFDLILCGRHSVDAETGQVGPEVAELLDVAQITGAHTIEVDVATRRITAERETDSGFETVEVAWPALVTAAEDLAPERFPSKTDREQAKQKSIVTVTAAELPLAAEQLGASGSPTWVAGLETIETKRRGQVLTGDTLGQVLDQLVSALLKHGLFGEWQETAKPRAVAAGAVPRAGAKDVWVLAEVLNERVRPVTYELLGKGAELAQRLGASVTALILGAGAERHATECAHYGAQRVLVADHPRLTHYDTELWAAIVADAIRARQPGVVLLPSTAMGRDLAPRVAARLGLGLTGDCVDLDLDGEGRLLQYKPAFGGSVVAPILSKTRPEMATVRPGLLDAGKPDTLRRAVVERLPVPNLVARVGVVAQRRTAESAAALDHAPVVIGVGMGLGSAANLAAIEPLAKVLNAAMCTTRDVSDASWLPRQYQVGLTGRAIAPQLYVAIAIRGAMEHMVGVRRAGVIVAINKNAKAPVFKAADYGIVGDYAEVVPLLTDRLQRARN
jgi:electron transfer flavoprotein alpha subunit